jgi:hypothetical protein
MVSEAFRSRLVNRREFAEQRRNSIAVKSPLQGSLLVCPPFDSHYISLQAAMVA